MDCILGRLMCKMHMWCLGRQIRVCLMQHCIELTFLTIMCLVTCISCCLVLQVLVGRLTCLQVIPVLGWLLVDWDVGISFLCFRFSAQLVHFFTIMTFEVPEKAKQGQFCASSCPVLTTWY